MHSNVELIHYVIVGFSAMGAQFLGGISGHGTSLLMPLVLIPLIGSQAVVPVLAISSAVSNTTRAVTFRNHVDLRKAGLVIACALPTATVGAFGFAAMSGPITQVIVGSMLVLLVPLRHWVARVKGRAQLSTRGVCASSACYGLLMGGSSGMGIVLMPILMASGMSGLGALATDAVVTTLLNGIKVSIFVSVGTMPPGYWLTAFIVGAMATPGLLLVRWLALRMSMRAQDRIIEVAVVIGGIALAAQALTL